MALCRGDRLCLVLAGKCCRGAEGKKQAEVDFIGKLMDGAAVNAASLSAEEKVLYKTFKVLTGDVLYSHSWLQD